MPIEVRKGVHLWRLVLIVHKKKLPRHNQRSKSWRSFLTYNRPRQLRRKLSGNGSSIMQFPPWLTFLRFPDCDKISPPLLQLSGVSFGYSADNLILKNIDFDVGLDSRIAVVGANGAGK